LQAIAAGAGGPTAVLNLDAHHDNERGEWQEDDPSNPRWAVTWARRILGLPGVDPARYFHFGLRGALNDRETFQRFTERGAKRENILTYRDLKEARRAGFDGWAEQLARRIVDGASRVWICIDPDVLNLGTNPDFGDEPMGPTNEEVIELMHQVGLQAGRDRFGGISFGAVPYTATSLHYACFYFVLYALAGVTMSMRA
jgi:arginase family enzyme